MSDVFYYNPGSLFQALNPDTNLQPLTDEPWVSQMSPEMKSVVSTDKGTYGAPIGTTFAGGVLYNKKVYADLGLKVPTDWAEFRANNEKIKAAGKVTPIFQSYASAFTWTAQLFVLGDFANVAAQDPSLAENYTANKAKYVDQPALQGFVNQQQAHDDGFFNKDYASATFDAAMKAVANGTAAHYPMLTGALSTIVQNYPDNIDDVGFFALPAQDAANTRVTMWLPNALYIPKTTEGAKLDAAKKFVAWVNSHRRLRRPEQGGFGGRTVRDQLVHAAGQRSAGRQGPRRLPQGRQVRPGAGVHLPDQGPEPGADHRRGRLGHQDRPNRAPRRTTTT